MTIQNLIDSLDYLVKAELTPFIWGKSGIGKSSVVKQYAKNKGYHFFPFYLGTQSDIGDILGLADFVRDKNGTAVATKFATPEWLKGTIDYCNENPDSGAVIFLDEFNRARRDILNGMFSLALDKTFHTLRLPKNCHVIAAGNPPTDEYFVTDVNETALMARFVHIKLEPTFDEWAKYADASKIDATIIGFLKGQPELLEGKHSEFELPVKVDRRAFERLDKLFRIKTPAHLLEDLMPGIIGLERTVAYMQYLKNVDKPLEGDRILNSGNRHIIDKWSNAENVMTSLLNLTTDNLKTYLIDRDTTKKSLTDEEKVNLMWFFSTVPKDVSYPAIRSLVEMKNGLFKEFFMDARYEKPLVELVRVAKGMEKNGKSKD
jgi:hypothetical protein